ncbi:MAG: archemetzincin [Gammaproteobacteria bacterium]|nr:MAG: archemetzincin [Gammaproteobacteria bacterium]
MRITLVPFQGVDSQVVEWLMEDLVSRGVDVRHCAPLPLPDAADPLRGQYRAGPLLEVARGTDGDHVLGITDRDLYTDGLNFVFGVAEMPGKAVVFSTHRLAFGAGRERLRERLLKEVQHELGHTLGLPHCPEPRCVMHFSNSLDDTDHKEADLCARCRRRLSPEGRRLVGTSWKER